METKNYTENLTKTYKTKKTMKKTIFLNKKKLKLK